MGCELVRACPLKVMLCDTHQQEQVGKLGTSDYEMGRTGEVRGSSEVTHTPPQSTLAGKTAPWEVRNEPLVAPTGNSSSDPECGPIPNSVQLLQQWRVTRRRGSYPS